MVEFSFIPSDERIVGAMIQLARAAKTHRMIVAGSDSADIFLELHRRGYTRVTTTKTCRGPFGQYDVALFAWREHSIGALETTLDCLARFLSDAGVLVVWGHAHERMPTLRRALQRLGFRIELGTSCENGVVISARRLASIPIAKVA